MSVSPLQSLAFQQLPLKERNILKKLYPEITYEPQAQLKTKGMHALTKKWQKSFKPSWQRRTVRSADRMTIPAIKRQLKSVINREIDFDITNPILMQSFYAMLLLHATGSRNRWAQNDDGSVILDQLIEHLIDNLKDDALKSFYNNWFDTWDEPEDIRFINNPRYFKQRPPRHFIVDGHFAGKNASRTKRKPTRRLRTRKHAVK